MVKDSAVFGSVRGPALFPEEDGKIKHVKILYGTDRKEIKINGPYVRYGEAADDIEENYKVGYTIVSVPPDHKPGVVEIYAVTLEDFVM